MHACACSLASTFYYYAFLYCTVAASDAGSSAPSTPNSFLSSEALGSIRYSLMAGNATSAAGEYYFVCMRVRAVCLVLIIIIIIIIYYYAFLYCTVAASDAGSSAPSTPNSFLSSALGGIRDSLIAGNATPAAGEYYFVCMRVRAVCLVLIIIIIIIYNYAFLYCTVAASDAGSSAPSTYFSYVGYGDYCFSDSVYSNTASNGSVGSGHAEGESYIRFR